MSITATDRLTGQLRAKSRARREQLAALSGSESRAPRRNDLLPQLKLVIRDPRELKAPARNVRQVGSLQVRAVAESVAALGFCAPVLIGSAGQVLDGMVRVEAAKLLGLPAIPCVIADHLSPAEARLLRLALNRLAEKGEWELDELRLELGELIVTEVPIEVAGFSPQEIDQILIGEEAEAVEQGPLAPEPGQGAVARVGDVFRCGDHRVACGDARSPDFVSNLFEGRLARLVLTDPPYNVPIAGHVTSGDHREFVMGAGEMSSAEFSDFNEAWIRVACAHLADGGLLAPFIDWRGLASITGAAAAADLEQLNLIVWAKTNAGMGSLWRSQHELLPVFKKGSEPHANNVQLGKAGRWRSNLWTYPGASSLGSQARQGLQHHPTVKPVAMLEDMLLDVTRPGDVVFDPFLGSGPTLIAAEKARRVCLGIELDPLYVDVIVQRYSDLAGKPVVLEATKETFEAVRERRAIEVPCQ